MQLQLNMARASLAEGVVPSQDLEFKAKYAYLVFYPGDFTFVCPTEIVDLNVLEPELARQEVEVFAISPDSPHVHEAWLKAPSRLRGLAELISIPLYSDPGNYVHSHYFGRDQERSDVLIEVATGKILYKRTNPLDVGRDFKDIVRIATSLNQLEAHPGYYCTAKMPDQALPKE